MTGFNTMKRSTLVSLIAISLCFVLMLGATWAWFSSTVTNEGNTIAVGTFKLDVTVNDVSIENSKDGTHAVSPVFTADDDKLAPGSDGIVKNLKVKNMGTIDMVWTADITADATNTDDALAAKINVTVKVGTQNAATYTLAELLADKTLATGTLATTEAADITVTVTLADDAGNDLQGADLGFNIVVTANQVQ